MSTARKWKFGSIFVAMLLICGIVNAQHRDRYYHSHRLVPKYTQPLETYQVNNDLNIEERLEMATAYLEKHEYLTIKKYAKMSGLNKASAETELNAFANNNNSPIQLVVKNKKRLYRKND